MHRQYYSLSKTSFTLIELIIIIAILAILAITSIPRIANITSIRIRLAGNRVQSDIRFAQSLAQSIQKRTRIIFNTSTDTYTVYIETSPGTWVITKDPLKRTDFIVTFGTDPFNGVDITGASFNGTNTLIFDKWGNPYGGSSSNPLTGNGTVVLNSSLSVNVRPGTGSVIISK